MHPIKLPILKRWDTYWRRLLMLPYQPVPMVQVQMACRWRAAAACPSYRCYPNCYPNCQPNCHPNCYTLHTNTRFSTWCGIKCRATGCCCKSTSPAILGLQENLTAAPYLLLASLSSTPLTSAPTAALAATPHCQPSPPPLTLPLTSVPHLRPSPPTLTPTLTLPLTPNPRLRLSLPAYTSSHLNFAGACSRFCLGAQEFFRYVSPFCCKRAMAGCVSMARQQACQGT